MKIEGPNRTGQTGPAKKKGKVSGDGSFSDLLSGGASETAAPASTHSLSKVDVLLAAQAVEDPTERAARQRMQQRANHILDELEQIRTALLGGTLTVGHVIDIADIIAVHREKIMDPRLTSILDEIDMRAQIEIAKMRMAMDKPSR